MTQKDKELLLKAIEQKRQEIRPTDTGEMKSATVPNNLEQGWLNALTWMERCIKSLPAEQPSEELEEEIKRKYESYNTLMMPIKDFRKLIHHFAQWQKNQTINKACEWLQKHMNDYIVHGRDIDFMYDDFRKAMEKEDEQ